MKQDTFTTKIPKDSRKRLAIPRSTYELLELQPGQFVRVTVERIEVDLTKINRTPEWKKMSQSPEP